MPSSTTYVPTVWLTGDVITQGKAANWEQQYNEATKLLPLDVLGGAFNSYWEGSSYPSGAGLDKLVPGSIPWYFDRGGIPAGATVAIEAWMRVNHASAVGTIALFNLSDGSPNTVMTGSEVSGTTGEQLGERIRSGSITMPAAGAFKLLGVKPKTNGAYRIWVWGIRPLRTA